MPRNRFGQQARQAADELYTARRAAERRKNLSPLPRLTRLGVRIHGLPAVAKLLRRSAAKTNAEFVQEAILERALREAGGNRQKAALLLGLHPTYFAALCKELNVKWL
jgi:hypothetical protein